MIKEDTIDKNSTTSKRFARCSNSKCGSIFLVNPKDLVGEIEFLCPVCRMNIETSHIVQCSSCQTIVSFIPSEPSEEPVVFYVEKCSHCSGTIQDELLMSPRYYPDAFI